jgi:hypothetical protein
MKFIQVHHVMFSMPKAVGRLQYFKISLSWVMRSALSFANIETSAGIGGAWLDVQISDDLFL